MNKKKILRIIGAIFAASLIVFAASAAFVSFTAQQYYQEASQAQSFTNIHNSFGFTRSAPVTQTLSYPFLTHEASSAPVVVWSKAMTGSVRLVILDSRNQPIGEWQGRKINIVENVELPLGAYTLEVTFDNYIGALRFGINNVQFNDALPSDQYQHIQANPTAGFHWDYLLYIPRSVQRPYLLVAPNNTGYDENDMRYHEASAKNLLKEMSPLADDLGTPVLVPIFPRPAGKLSEYYTHNLDRNVLLMEQEGYQRIDLQLLAMVDDARGQLAAKKIEVGPRFMMWGFSASGAFTDRFSLLHSDRLIAVAAGGSNNSLPFATYAGENLPYPVGVYDYAEITGAPFDAETFKTLPRFLYKGDQDSGGTITTDTDVYPADEYFDRFVRADVEARLKTAPRPLISGTSMDLREEDMLRYRIYQGAVFVDEFCAASRLYTEAGLVKSQFKLYPGVGHEITDEMRADLKAFFLANMP